MSKELEALDFIKKSPYRNWKGKVNTIEFNFETEIKIIEKALKRLEEMDDVYHILVRQRAELIEEKRKQDEILRIIKEKSVDVSRIQATTKVGEYNFWRLSTLTKEEYDLLKEVLL